MLHVLHLRTCGDSDADAVVAIG